MPFTRQDPPFVNRVDDPNGPRINATWHNKVDKGVGDAHDELANHVSALEDFTNEARNIIMPGGGDISWGVVADKFKWSARFMLMPVSENLSSDRFISFTMPTSGVADAQGVERASVDGVILQAYENLWLVHTRGSTATAGNSWRVLSYTDTLMNTYFDDENAFLIAVRNNDNSSLYIRNGLVVKSGRTMEAGYGAMFPTWGEVDQKPDTFAPSAHKTSHATGGADALAASDIDAAPRLSPALNLMPDSGRYGGKQNPMSLYTPGAYTNPGWLSGFNGTTDAEIGKFIHNNTTNGGTAGAITQSVIDLLATMGRTGTAARYGTEFYVSKYTMGTGTAAPYTSGGVTRYLVGSNNAKAMFGPGALNTFAGWVRCTAMSIVFRRITTGLGSVVRAELDGVEQASDIILTPADGWKHVLVLAKTFAGYDSGHPYIYAETGSTWEIACPYFAAGEVNLDWRNDHDAPLPTINDLLA